MLTNDQDSEPRLTSQESFSGLAPIYDKYRTGYPDAAVVKILEGFAVPVRVADVGCGTGIASRLLAAHGCVIVGIEPNADMIEHARRTGAPSGARLEYRIGTGDDTGLAGGSVDVVLCAQSYQWLRPERALAEFHRILKPGGRLALMWNDKSDTDPFTVTFSRILKQAQAEARRAGQWQERNDSRDPSETGLFKNVRKWSFPNPQPLDLEGVLGRARSTSFFPKDGEARKDLERQLGTLFEQHARDGVVVLHHDTELTLANRRNG